MKPIEQKAKKNFKVLKINENSLNLLSTTGTLKSLVKALKLYYNLVDVRCIL